MKKKLTLLLALSLSLLIAFGLVGCGASDSLETALKADYSNVTITMAITNGSTTNDMTFKATSSSRYLKMTNYEGYYEKTATAYYEYNKVGTAWEKSECTKEEWDSTDDQTSMDGFDAADFDKSGSVYTLKADKLAAYGAKVGTEITKLVITVKNNKLQKYELTYNAGEGSTTSMSAVMTYSDIGKTTITMPTVA